MSFPFPHPAVMAIRAAVMALAVAAPLAVLAQANTTFTIQRFELEGNTLLSEAEQRTLLAPFVGEKRGFADVQLAQEALERAYRGRGFTAVAVSLPEQEITQGVIRLTVTEARFGKVRIKGAVHYDEPNIRRSLPHVVPGAMPQAMLMAEQVSLANESPAKKATVVLRIAEQPGEVDAEISVEDRKPTSLSLSVDNTGEGSTTGEGRLGLTWQHANLWNRDHVLTVQYTTSPTHMSDVKVLSAGYHVPLYDYRSSLDVFAGYSQVDAGTVTLAATVPVSFAGNGRTFGFRLNRQLPRGGEYEHKLSLGWDWKAFDNECSFFGNQSCGPQSVDVTTRPVSLTYSGNLSAPGSQTLFNLSHARNLPGGPNGEDADFAASRPSSPGPGGAPADFSHTRAALAYQRLLPAQWQARGNFSGQWTNDALVPGEQFGLAGANAVRGFNERQVARDRGLLMNLELYAPDFAKALPFKAEGARVLFFYDWGVARNNALPGEDARRVTLASVGVGARLVVNRLTTLKLDVARVLKAETADDVGDWKAHLVATWGF
jgi:hemolysin activation/secretion protein